MEKLELEQPPTAFVYSSILSAMGGMRAANMHGLRPGKDISLATFDDQLSFLQSKSSSRPPPYMTNVSSSIQDAGRRVGEMLIEQIANSDAAPVCELWKTNLVVGESTGRLG